MAVGSLPFNWHSGEMPPPGMFRFAPSLPLRVGASPSAAQDDRHPRGITAADPSGHHPEYLPVCIPSFIPWRNLPLSRHLYGNRKQVCIALGFCVASAYICGYYEKDDILRCGGRTRAARRHRSESPDQPPDTVRLRFRPPAYHHHARLEGFYSDSWGNTFFFIDHDFNSRNAAGQVIAPSGTYLEIARCLNFWQNTALAPLSLHIEYDGGVYRGYTINNALLAGIDWFIHSKDFRNTLNLKLLYKYIAYTDIEFRSRVPLQFTAAWTMKNLFGLGGLTFTGFADFWWEDHTL